MWRKPTEGQPSSPAPVSPASNAPIKTQNVPQASAPVIPPQPAPKFSPPVVESPAAPAAPVARGTSQISSGLKINGELSGETDLVIDGEVQGKIRMPGARVTVGPSGRVQADIEAREIVINGSVQGNLKAGDSTRLGSTSRVTGSVLTPRIGIDDGARLRGKVEMTPVNTARPSVAVPATSNTSSLNPETAGVKGE